MNYYVMDENHQMRFRGTLGMCRNWVRETNRQWKAYGFKPRTFSIFYDTATVPTEIITD